MSDGNWLKRNTPFVAGTVGGAVFLAFLIYAGVEQAGYNYYSQTQASNYAENAADEKRQACVGIVEPELSACLSKAETEYQLKTNAARRDYSDLIAQRKSALWAMIMGLAALIGMALSAVGVWLVYATFKATKDQLEDSRSNAMPEMFLEPSVSVGPAGNDPEMTKLRIVISVTNFGGGGGHDLSFGDVAMAIIGKRKRYRFFPPEYSSSKRRISGNGGSFSEGFAPAKLTNLEDLTVKDGDRVAATFTFGYTDQFGRRHTTNERYEGIWRLRGDAAGCKLTDKIHPEQQGE